MKVAIYLVTGELVLVKESILCSEVMFEAGGMTCIFFMAELGGSSNFEIIGDL